MKTTKRQYLTRGGGISVNSSHLPTHSQTPSHKSHFFKPLIASSLALALGVSVASAQCQIIDGNPTGTCFPASQTNSGMFLGIDAANLGSEIPINNNLSNFMWITSTNDITPTNGDPDDIIPYQALNFEFNATQGVSGSQGASTSEYTITLGTNSKNNKAFLLNVGDKPLSSNLRIDFANSQDFTYYLKAGGLKGKLTLKGNGKFIANLLGGITGAISNTGVEAIFNINGNNADSLTIGSITANGGTNNFNFTGSLMKSTVVEVNSGISATDNGANNFTLNSTTGKEINLTLNGDTNQIAAFTTFGKKQNTLTITNGATNNSISTLTLGTTTGTPTNGTLNLNTANALAITNLNVAHQSGTLNIDSNSKGVVTITTVTLDNKKTLTLNNQNTTSDTLKLTGLTITGVERNSDIDTPPPTDTSKFIFNGSGNLGIETLTTSKSVALEFKSGTSIVENKIEIQGDGENVFRISQGARLTLEGGFEVAAGGRNRFFVDGTLSLGLADKTLTTSGTDTLNHFDIGANGDIADFYNQFEATKGGKNLIVSDKALNLVGLSADGQNSINEVYEHTSTSGKPQTSGNFKLTLTGDVTATNQGFNEISVNTVKVNDITAKTGGKNTIQSTDTLTFNDISNNEGNIYLTANSIEGKQVSVQTSNASDPTNLKINRLKSQNITLASITASNGGINYIDANGKLIISSDVSATGANSQNFFGLAGGNQNQITGNITEASGGQNLFTLDSTSEVTSLTLEGATNQITSLNVFGENGNTLTITDGRTANSISTLTLGTTTRTPTDDTLNLSSASVLTIGDLKLANTSGTLNIIQGSKEKVTITTVTLGGKTLTIDNASNQALVINTLTTSDTNTLNLNKGGAKITGKITARSGVTNSFNIKSGATLTLAGGFETDGGTNAFNISGTLNLGTQSSKDLTTSNDGTTSFTIHKGATFNLTNKNITASTGGANIIESDGDITLGNIKAEGNGSNNTITIKQGSLALGQITSTDSGKNSFTIGDEKGSKASLTLNTSTGVTTTKGGTTSFTIKNGSTLTLQGGQGSTLKADGATNEFTIENGATVSVNGGNGFYDTITATNSGKNIIKTSASFNLNALTANGGTNEITLGGTATGDGTKMTVGAITTTAGENNFTLDSSEASTKTALTLSGVSNAINTFNALGGDNQLTITADSTGTNTITNLVLGATQKDGQTKPAKSGFLTIANNTQDKVLTITNFEGKHTESKLTISAGAVNIENLANTGENNNIALTGATLTLSNGGTLKSLEATAGTNTINFAKDTTIESGITAGSGATNTINLSSGVTLTSAIKADAGANTITLTGTNSTISATINGAMSGIAGKNNITLDSKANAGDKTNLTLKGGDAKTITNLTALSNDSSSMNTLTIDQQATGKHTITNLVLGDSENGGKAGFLTIDNKTTGNALAITNFEGKHTESKLTISTGAVNIENLANTGENNNITLTGATLTLNNANGNSTIASLTTTGTNNINFASGTTTITSAGGISAGAAGVINNIKLGEGATLTSAITANGGTNNITLANNSNITGDITATSGANIITLTGTNSTISATINGEISGVGNSITLDSSGTKGDKTNLTLSGANDKTITNLTALSNDASSMNALTIAENAKGTNKIENLKLGDSGTKTGFLTITNKSGNALTITELVSQDVGNILTINTGEVAITNAVTNTGLSLNGATLTLKGANNNFALGVSGTSSLKFGDNAVSNTISTLTLGTTTDGTLNLSSTSALTIGDLNVANKVGILNIASDSKGVSITTATLKGGKTLKLNDDRKDATLTISTLKTQGIDNQIYFHKNLKITTLSETTGAIKDDNKDNTSLTFVNQLTKNTDAQDPNKVTYTAGLLTINGSTNNAQLKGIYKMIIRGDKTIKPKEIKENIKVATIKKYDGATSGDTQEQLRNQGVINLGKETGTTLAEDLTLLTFNYYVTETDGSGNSQANGDYITYFLNGHGEAKLDIKQNILSNLALSATELYLANFNSLNRRMGELRDNNHSQGVWGRVFNGMQSNDANLKSSALYTTVQAGYDYGFGLGEGVTNYLGFALSYGHSESGFKNKAIFENNFASIDSLKSDLVEVALYNSYVQDSGWYNDTVAKFSYLLNQVRYSSQSFMETSSNQGDINTYAFTLSNEFGYRFKLGASDEWYIDPQAEIGFGYFEGKEFDFSGTKLGVMDSLLTLRSRFGASFGYDFKNFTSKESGLSAKLYLGVFGEVDYFNGGDVKFGSESAQWAINTDTRAVLNVGTNLEIKESTRLYLDVESSFGGKITTDYKINAGVRYSFGEKIQFLDAKNQENKEEAPLKLQEEEKNTQEQTEKDVKEEANAGGKEEAKM